MFAFFHFFKILVSGIAIIIYILGTNRIDILEDENFDWNKYTITADNKPKK